MRKARSLLLTASLCPCLDPCLNLLSHGCILGIPPMDCPLDTSTSFSLHRQTAHRAGTVCHSETWLQC